MELVKSCDSLYFSSKTLTLNMVTLFDFGRGVNQFSTAVRSAESPTLQATPLESCIGNNF